MTPLPGNWESWIGLTPEHIKTLQEYQNELKCRVLAAPQQGTPTGVIEMDSGMMLTQLIIKQVIGQVMLNVTVKTHTLNAN